MAVPEGVRSANPHAKSLFERIATASNDVLWRRLLAWAAVVAVTSVIAELALPRHFLEAFKAASSSTLVLGACVGFGGAVYFLARFVLTWELRHLLSAAAFSVLGGGMGLQALVDQRMPESSSAGWVSTIAWPASALLFACSAHTRISCPASTRRNALVQSVLASALVLLSPLIALPYVVNGTLFASLADLAYRSAPIVVAGMVAKLTTIVFYAVAFIGFYRHTHEDSDRMSGLLCFAFVPLLIGLMVNIGSTNRFDEWSIMCGVLSSASWLVMVGGFGIENAIMQRDVQDRLQELDALHQVSWSIVGAGSVRDLLDMFARTHQEQLGAKVAAVYLSDEERENLELFAICGLSDYSGTVGRKYPIQSSDRRPGFHTGHTVKAFLTKEVQIANDVFVDVEFVPWKLIASDDGCAASLPLVTGGNAIGVVNLYFGDCRQLTRQRLRLLATITGAAAPAIASARVREAAEELSTERNELDRAA
ncbi:MAG: GAF domain-containing protein [Armatimonadota bacterium]